MILQNPKTNFEDSLYSLIAIPKNRPITVATMIAIPER